MKIITIGRQFGSGGRELGCRLAELTGFAYYDREIITEIAKQTNLSEKYVKNLIEQRPKNVIPITIGNTFYALNSPVIDQAQQVYSAQEKIIKEMAAGGDCIFVGRCADYILREQNPMRMFIYADMESRVARCKARKPEDEALSDKEMIRNIKAVDKNRAKYYEFYTGLKWGDPENYNFMLNTGKSNVKELAISLAEYIK